MTVRTAEFLMASVMTIVSGYLMWKSAELPIGWIPEEGPGGGFWPFWLSALMLISCIGILVNWFRKRTAISRSEEPYFAPGVFTEVGMVALALIVTVALFNGIGVAGFGGIGVYGALPLFLLFYLKFVGRHSWVLTIACMVIIPVVTFLFFEIALKITLPKGITEELFYPLYRILL